MPTASGAPFIEFERLSRALSYWDRLDLTSLDDELVVLLYEIEGRAWPSGGCSVIWLALRLESSARLGLLPLLIRLDLDWAAVAYD